MARANEKVGEDYPSARLFTALAMYKMGEMDAFNAEAKRYFSLMGEDPPASLSDWAEGMVQRR
jgi:hypothetical protein